MGVCHVPLTFQYVHGWGDNKSKNMDRVKGMRFPEERREMIFPGTLYTDDLLLRTESELNLREMIGRFVEACKRKKKEKKKVGRLMYIRIRWCR